MGLQFLCATRLVSEIRSTYNKSNLKRTGRGVEGKMRSSERMSDWNQRFPSGTRVKLKMTGELRRQESEAMLLFGSISAIYLLGCKGILSWSRWILWIDVGKPSPISEMLRQSNKCLKRSGQHNRGRPNFTEAF